MKRSHCSPSFLWTPHPLSKHCLHKTCLLLSVSGSGRGFRTFYKLLFACKPTMAYAPRVRRLLGILGARHWKVSFQKYENSNTSSWKMTGGHENKRDGVIPRWHSVLWWSQSRWWFLLLNAPVIALLFLYWPGLAVIWPSPWIWSYRTPVLSLKCVRRLAVECFIWIPVKPLSHNLENAFLRQSDSTSLFTKV